MFAIPSEAIGCSKPRCELHLTSFRLKVILSNQSMGNRQGQFLRPKAREPFQVRPSFLFWSCRTLFLFESIDGRVTLPLQNSRFRFGPVGCSMFPPFPINRWEGRCPGFVSAGKRIAHTLQRVCQRECGQALAPLHFSCHMSFPVSV